MPKMIETCMAVVVIAFAHTALADMKLVDNGKSNFSILTDRKAPDSVKQAAMELQDLVNKVTGIELPLVTNISPGKSYISIGVNNLSKNNGITVSDLKKDGFMIIEKNGNVFLIGNDKDTSPNVDFLSWSPYIESDSVGSYFAMSSFARRFLGVEWYMPGEKGMELSRKTTISVPTGLHIKEEPFFKDRFVEEVAYIQKATLQKYKKSGLYKHNYFNKKVDLECRVWGRHMLLGNSKLVNFQHAWFYYIPALKPSRRCPHVYGKTHPEYFALVGGVRQTFYYSGHHGGQLCVSNEDVARTYANNIIAYGKKSGASTFSLSSNDGGGQCECEKCRAWDDVDPVTGERILSSRFLQFANRVAELVVKEIPDVRLGQYAYQVSLQPPIRPINIHPNIYIGDVYNSLPNAWCSGEKQRAIIRKYINTWREMSSHVTLTTYYNIYGNWGFPWDSTDVVGEVVKELAKHTSSDGVRMYNCRGFGLSPGVDGARLWVLSRLLWNPKLDYKKLQDEYYRGAFGENAGKAIRRYFDTINVSTIKVMERYPMQIGKRNIPMQCTYPEKIYTPIRLECSTLINKAVKAAASESPAIQWRVSRVARAWRFTELTLASVRYARMVRTGRYKDSGLTMEEAWEKAISAGRKRRTMLEDPDNYYALAAGSADICQKQRPLGIVEKKPKNIHLYIAAPLIKRKQVTLDGKLEEPIWRGTKESAPFRNNKTGKEVAVKTWVRMYRTNSDFVIGLYCEEPLMKQLKSIDDPDMIWKGDDIEMFFSLTGGGLDYRQFLINPDGVRKAYIMRGDQGLDNHWKPAWKTEVFKGKDFWSAEIILPFTSLGLSSGDIRGKDIFLDFCRERYTGGTLELSAWAPTGGGFAQPSKFGRISFTPLTNSGRMAHKNSGIDINLLPNGSFEEGYSKWERKNTKTLKFSLATKGALDGKKCALIEFPGGKTKYITITCKVRGLAPGRTYKFKAWIKTEGIDDSSSSGVSLRMYGGKGISTPPVKPLTWQPQSVQLTLPEDENTIRLYVRVKSDTPAKVWIDKTCLEPVED